jgi:SAM-dependent methyltransferase
MFHDLVYRKLYSIASELRLGIRTTGSERIPEDVVDIPYVPVPYRVIFPILARISLSPDDVFIDVGCGKGRMVCCASRWPARKVIGVDVNPALIKTARANAAKTRGRVAEVECLQARAEQFDYSDATVVYLYHPFRRPVMDMFLTRLDQTRHRGRSMRVVYANAVHEDALSEARWLTKEDEWAASKIGGFPHTVSFWRSKS